MDYFHIIITSENCMNYNALTLYLKCIVRHRKCIINTLWTIVFIITENLMYYNALRHVIHYVSGMTVV